jgi:hypothetical protein
MKLKTVELGRSSAGTPIIHDFLTKGTTNPLNTLRINLMVAEMSALANLTRFILEPAPPGPLTY